MDEPDGYPQEHGTIREEDAMSAIKAAILAVTIPVVLSVDCRAQGIQDIICNNITLSATMENQFVVLHAYNGCPQGAVYVAVCVTLADGTRVSRQTVGLVPYGQTRPITIGTVTSLNMRAPLPWVSWSLIARNPCS